MAINPDMIVRQARLAQSAATRERRDRFAAIALAEIIRAGGVAMTRNIPYSRSVEHYNDSSEVAMAEKAVEYADALIAELDKPK